MPHIHISFTPNLPAQDNLETLALNLHHAISPVVTSGVENFKSYILPLNRIVFASNDKEKALLRIDIRMYAGRSDEVKQQVAEIIINEAKKLFTDASCTTPTEISVEVRDIEKENSHSALIND